MSATDKDIIAKARQIAQGDVQIWNACMQMAHWILDDRVESASNKSDETDWRAKTASLSAQVQLLNFQNQQSRELLDKALHLIQDPKASWGTWIGETLPLVAKKKA